MPDVYAATAKGLLQARNPASALAPQLRSLLGVMDGRATADQLATRLRMPGNALRQALLELEGLGYIEPVPAAVDDEDLDFTSPAAVSRLEARAEERQRAEAAAQARAQQAERDAAAAQAREQDEARAQAHAEAQAARAAREREQAEAAAKAADSERSRAAAQASAAQTPEMKAQAQARMEAALLAEAKAAAEARVRAEAEAQARNVVAASAAAAAQAREEAQARARAESEARASAHAEAHARAMIEAQLKAMSTALARAQALARDEADARARITSDLEAIEAREAQARAEAAAAAREEAEAVMREELKTLREEAARARLEAEARAESERRAREAAEAVAAGERRARAAAEAQARAEREELLDAQRRAQAATRAATEARVQQERNAREAAESRADAEAQARLAHEAAVEERAEIELRQRLVAELAARELAEREADARYRAEVARRAQQAVRPEEPAPSAVLQRRRMPLATAVQLGAGGFVFCIIGAALLLPLVPLDSHVGRAEKTLGALLQQPVNIGRLQYRLLPAPELVMERVVVGPLRATRVERVSISAWPWELNGDELKLDRVVLTGTLLEQGGFAALRRLDAPQTRAVRVGQLVLDGARVTVQDTELGVSRATLRYDRDGSLRSAIVTAGNAKLEITPATRSSWEVRMTAQSWQPPLGPALQFETLSMRGLLDDGKLTAARIEARIAGGELVGTLKAGWRDGVRAEGEFDLSEAQLQRLLPAYTTHFSARGTLAAHGSYVFQSRTLGKLLQSPRVEASFTIAGGELRNVDLVRALQSVSAKGVQGGLTRFEQLIGSVELAGDRYRYRGLKLVSGPLTAAGQLDVLPGNQLGGRVAAEVASATQPAFRGALTVSGTLTNPVLRP